MKVSDSEWHKRLSGIENDRAAEDCYWLGPFRTSSSNCPYLVGSYNQVAVELRRYIESGFEIFILDIPPTEEELHHIGIVFRRAAQDLATAFRINRADPSHVSRECS